MLPVVVLVSVLAAGLGVWAVAFAVAGRAVILRQLIGAGVVEVALVVQGVVLAALQLGGSHVTDPVTLWGYLLVALLLLPGAGVVAFVERTRWSSIILAVAALTIIVMELRMWQLWQA
ncbi:hypothetical protein [uncultured Georgenia sp.]|uniref:hypothetical protein n=1 Tax=uncultured Georgenia sp. TaxID=378209 RepID=UPI00261CD41C|nr:hypothetical protein [uncultured Georgenia sp.]HLV05161.1 hypothetical protein [Actinomycetaceae bacterium]